MSTVNNEPERCSICREWWVPYDPCRCVREMRSGKPERREEVEQ